MTLLELCDPEPATVGLDSNVADAIRRMLDQHVGAVAIIDAERRVAGIFTERDVLRKVALSGRDPATTPVRELMTTPVEMATVATGIPAGICTIDSSESSPSRCFSGTGTSWPCLSDPHGCGKALAGHGRGMCQWGTQNWSIQQGKERLEQFDKIDNVEEALRLSRRARAIIRQNIIGFAFGLNAVAIGAAALGALGEAYGGPQGLDLLPLERAPWSDVGVMIELGHDDLVARLDRGTDPLQLGQNAFALQARVGDQDDAGERQHVVLSPRKRADQQVCDVGVERRARWLGCSHGGQFG